MRRTASPVILDMKGSLPTTRMVVLPETEPATRPPKASSIDLPSTVDEIRTLREELRAEQSMIEQIHKIRRREEAYRVGSEKELCAMIKRANAEKRALEQTMSRALSRDMQKEEELREKDEQLRQKNEEIARRGFLPGRWIAELKAALRSGAGPETLLQPARQDGEVRDCRLKELESMVTVTPGQKIGYVVDTRFNPDNLAVLLPLLRGATTLYCEASFLDEDRDQAAMRYHLTAAEAGALGRLAEAKRLRVFHYSSRYQGKGDRLREEADRAFRGRKDPGVLAEFDSVAV